MLEYDRIDVSEGTGVDKTTDSHECNIYRYWYLLKINVRFHQKEWNSCHYLMQKAMSLIMLQLFQLKGMVIKCIFGIEMFFNLSLWFR